MLLGSERASSVGKLFAGSATSTSQSGSEVLQSHITSDTVLHNTLINVNYKALIAHRVQVNYSACEGKEKPVMARQKELDYAHRSLSVW